MLQISCRVGGKKTLPTFSANRYEINVYQISIVQALNRGLNVACQRVAQK